MSVVFLKNPSTSICLFWLSDNLLKHWVCTLFTIVTFIVNKHTLALMNFKENLVGYRINGTSHPVFRYTISTFHLSKETIFIPLSLLSSLCHNNRNVALVQQLYPGRNPWLIFVYGPLATVHFCEAKSHTNQQNYINLHSSCTFTTIRS